MNAPLEESLWTLGAEYNLARLATWAHQGQPRAPIPRLSLKMQYILHCRSENPSNTSEYCAMLPLPSLIHHLVRKNKSRSFLYNWIMYSLFVCSHTNRADALTQHRPSWCITTPQNPPSAYSHPGSQRNRFPSIEIPFRWLRRLLRTSLH